MKLRAFLCTSLFLLGRALPATPQEIVAPRFIEDNGHIVVIEHDGENYDRDTPLGELNAAPRRRIAQKLIETHGDFYDFIVVFTNFDFDRDGAIGFYLNVRNDVEGINLPVVDNGDRFGSPARLQGFIDMGPISQYRVEPLSLEPGDPNFRTTLGVLAHEVGHRWLTSVRYDSGGGPRTDLLGLDDAHWSFLLSSDASFLYGNAWEPVGGDLYRSVEIQSRFSELDLYLMGFLAPEEVSPLSLLVNPDVDPTRLPELGAEIEAIDVETVTVDQIIAVEGARSPNHDLSQKDFAVAFVFLTAESLLPTARDLEAVELIRSNFTDTFFGLTRGRALVDPDLQTVAPVTPGAIPDTSLAISWLLSQQQPDGRFEAHPLTALRDTSTAVVALATLGIRGTPVDDARTWMSLQNPTSVDYLARALAAGAALPLERLASFRNSDGGFGTAPGYRSDPLDTALALTAFLDTDMAIELAGVIASMQLADGSWSSIAGQPGDVMTTSEVALALALTRSHRVELQDALAWLVERQQLDGGFGDGPSAPYASARVLEAFLNGSVPPTAIDRAIAYLEQTQSVDGSWSGSVFETASVLQALVPSTFANLSIEASDIHLDPNPPEVGDTVTVEVSVRNRSRVSASSFAGSFDVQLFDGDPEAGGLAIGAPQIIDELAGGSTRVLTFEWDTTGLEGLHTLFAIADFAGVVSEVSREDNVAMRDVEVLPPLPNLVITQLSADPPSPIVATATTLTVRVANTGSAPAGATNVRFFREVPRLGIELGEAAVSALAPGGSVDVAFVWDTTGELGEHTLYAVVDPDDTDVRERIETDNEASTIVDIRPPPPAQPDLEVQGFALTPNELERLPQDVAATARIANTGLDPVPSVLVELFQGHPDLGGVLVTSDTIAVGGDTGVDVALGFTVTTGGTRTYYLRVDASPVVERDDTNNLEAADLRDLMDVVDVAPVPGSIVLSETTIDPTETLTVDVTVRNTGTRPLSSVTVALFYEVSPGGPFRLASTLNVSLDPGASEIVRLSWVANRSGTVPLEVRVDPDNVLSETNEDDNILATSVDVTASTLPNLNVAAADITSIPASLAEGMSATLTAVVRNLGDGAATPFEVRFYTGDPARDGLLIGSAAIADVPARGDTVASVVWDPVNVRGATLLFVEVDPGAAVEEIDELDNLTFRVVDIEGLPDLLATTAQLRMSPPFAHSGEVVSIEASFTNAGDQASAPMAVEIRLDDPLLGAVIATEEFADVAPGETKSFSASWDTTGIEGEHAIYLVLDVRDDVAEQREDNNVVRLAIALQDADVFVAPLFFSPNGDGVQDEAALFYRLSAAGEIRVEVQDDEGGLVRGLSTTPGDIASVVWDGRDGNGVLARDGAYFFVALADDVEVLRRRVVLDTNRSSVVEALGTDLVSFTQLTCPLPAAFRLEGPAWLPSDRAAYFMVTAADPTDAPDYPVGLYRISSDARSTELVLEDPAFEDLEFIDHIGDFDGDESFAPQRLHPVAADGQRALVKGRTDGIQILDLATGERTPLGHDARSSGMWTSDGRRILVRSPTGLFFYDATGALRQTLSTANVALALLAPDELRILYRILDEAVLRVIHVDGSGDRVLESTDATNFFGSTVAIDKLVVDQLRFLQDGSAHFGWRLEPEGGLAGPFELDIDEDTIEDGDFFGELSWDEKWQIGFASSFRVARRFRGRETRPIIPSTLGGGLEWSYRDTHISYTGEGGDGCVGTGVWLVRSLVNGEADFRLTRLPSRFGVQITGTVSDLNLDTYTLEFARVETPDAFTPIQPPSDVPVIADTITTWIPPAPGDYLVRLTLRDKAGNVTVRLDRIFWEETLPIAGLRRAPAYVSPNGDLVMDEMLVEYDVLTPTNLVFHIRDEEGRSVRRIERDELVIGPASFIWDGTDDSGITVDDGRYVLEIQGAEFPVIVDTAAPRLEGTFSELYTITKVFLAVDLTGHVLDDELDAWELTTAGGDILVSAIREVGTEDEAAVILEGVRAVQGLEIRARDRAGNETVLPLTGPSREVRIVSARRIVGPEEPGPPRSVPPQFILPRSTLSLAALASFEGAMHFRYNVVGESTVIDVPVTSRVALAAEDLILGAAYVGHFEADGVVSQEVRFTVGPDAIFLQGSSGPFFLVIRMSHTIDEPLVEGRLLRGAEVLKEYRPVPSEDEILQLPLPCGVTVGYSMEATGASGTVYRSTTRLAYPAVVSLVVSGKECLSVDDAGIETQPDPSAPVPETAIAFVNSNLSEPPESVILLLDGGAGETEVGSAVGVDGRAGVSFDVGTLPEQDYTLRTRGILPGGGTVEGDYALRFFLDQSPPEVAIVSPAEGGVACVATVEGKDIVPLDVLIRDREIATLAIEMRQPDGSWESLFIVGLPELPLSEIATSLPVVIPDGVTGELTLRLLVTNSRFVSERAERPTPHPPKTPLWPIPRNNGGLAAVDVRTLIVPASLGLGPITTDVELFSPNADGIVDVVRIRGEALEAATLTVRVRPRSSSSRVRTIVSELPTSVGFFEFVWDGRDDSGLVVEDGEYFVEVEAVNGCGGMSTVSVVVEVDNTAPTVAITNLVDDQPISVAVEVIGTATDEHFDNYVLEFGEGASPLSFTQLMPPVIVTRQVDNNLLGNWSVGDLDAGIYTLRLSAVDVVGNRALAPVRLEVLAAEFIERYVVDPALISPNGDSVKDQAEIELDLKAEARVTLTILNSASTPVTTLIDGAVLPIGPHTAIWDGLGVADGDYVAVLRAEHPTASTLFEESEIAITVDTVAPAVTIASPAADGFQSLPAAINGSITDDHLERFEIEVGPTAGALTTVAEDTLPASGVLARLSSLGDGSYRLRATASDQAGNTTELDFIFEIDSTPPALVLTAPIEGTFVARLPGGVPLPVTGSVEEANLDRYDLEVGFGDPPSVFVPLAGGTSVPTEPTLATWDLETLPDGHYTLRLSATDQAANFRIVETDVILDTTPPTVVIETPAPDAVASEAIGVGGTVNDDNFHAGTLGVAPATTPDRVTELQSFTSPVTAGVLVESLALVDGSYILELRAEDLAGNVATTTTAFVIDTEPPLPPLGLTATPEARDVTLSWTASPSSDVVGYHLSRDGVRITAEPVPVTSFVDTDLDEGVYRYTVLAVDAAKLESEPTEPATARIDLTPPNVVLRSPDEGDRVRVEVDVIGTAFSESDFFEYRLSVAPVETPLSPTLLKRSSVPVSFDTLGLWRPLTDGDYILTLKGEDTSGNVAQDSVRVTVDNTAPVAPVLVRAEALAKPDDIEIEWTAPSDTDVDGFLVYRNGQIANAPGTVSGSLRPFLVPGPTYVDAELPDGEHCYRVAAMDIAGNISADSNELCVFLDNREPKAIIFDPEDGARFDAARTIRAESPDLDIATVSFEYQLVGDTVWTVIALDTDGEPFETIWDITGIDFGDYLLRAVATDIGTRSDPAPETIGVTLGDVTPPGAPSDLSARVVGDSVELSWVGVTDSDLAGYRIFRDDTLVLEPGAAAVSAIDTGVLDGDYVYTLRAVDADENESDPSNAAAARVYAPTLVPAFPVFETAAVDLPGAGASPGATARLFDAGTTDEVAAATTADASGGFLYSALSLPLGTNLLEAEATDADANVSRRSREALLIRNDVPAQPTGFVAVASGDDANLSWDPNGEADLSGYLITRDGEVLNTRGFLRPSGPIPTSVTVAASVNEGSAPGVIGSGRWTINSDEEQWIELTMAEPRHLDQIRLWWTSNRAAKDYDLLIELEGRLAPIVRVRDQAPTFLSEHTLPIPVQTTRVRLHIFSGATPFGIFLDEFELIGILPETTAAFTDATPAPGVYDYAVEAIDALGGRSLAAGPIALGVGDLTPPAAPTLTATVDVEDVELSWPAIADAVRYRIFRDDAPLREATSTFVTDNNLLNGTYAYHVIAIDAAGNESGPSNVEIVTVDVAPPPPPVLTVTLLTIGRALSLSWTESMGPLGVSTYVIARSTTMGGPYSEIASVGGSTFAYLDSGLEGGVEYFYVVHAVDFRGEASDLSNEASGIPTDTAPPPAPIWISPESPLTVTASRIELLGAAEPATTVEVFRDGVSISATSVSDEFRLVAEPFIRSTSNISRRFAVSPDRTVVAEVGSPSSFGNNEVRLYDLRTGAARTVPYEEDRSFERGVSFSPNGRYIAVATTIGSPINRAIRILDLETETTEVLALTEAPQAPAFLNDDELAVVVGDDIRIFDLALDTERTIYTPASFFSPENLAASTDGAYVAWNESGELYVMPVAGGAPELVFDSFLLEDFEWAGARTLVFEAFGLGLHFYDVETLSSVLIPDTEDLRFPTSLGIDDAVSAFDGSVAYWVFADGAVMELGESSANFNRQFFAWSQDLLLVGTTFGFTLALVETPGRFGLEARLEPGLNVLIARATDEEGNVSPDSDALELTYDNSSLADLTFDGEITIVPSVPLTGDSASISIPIVNAGASPSPESSVSVTGAELSGTLYTVGAATIPALDSGASTTVVLPWLTAGRIGPQSIQAVIDPLELVDEFDETNNTAGVSTTVVGTAGLELTITTGRPSYAAGQVAELTVSAVNGGGAFDGVLETRIEDTIGAVVALVDSRSSSLAYGASTRYGSFWTTGSIASGTYVARVTAFSGSDVVATATASFELTRTLDITLDVIPERPFYEQGDLVRLLARVANVASNTPLRDLSLRYRIVDPGAVTVFDSTVPLGYLAIGGAVSTSGAWTSGADELGTYSVSVDAFEGAELVASGAATFDMTAASTITLTGALTLASEAVPAGSEVIASYTIDNESVIELTSATVRVELFDAVTATTVASTDAPLTLTGGDTASGELRIDTAGLELGGYSVVLSAGDATLRSLASAPVTLFATPAAPSLNAPAETVPAHRSDCCSRSITPRTRTTRLLPTNSRSISIRASPFVSAPHPVSPKERRRPHGPSSPSSKRTVIIIGAPVRKTASRRATGWRQPRCSSTRATRPRTLRSSPPPRTRPKSTFSARRSRSETRPTPKTTS